DYFVPIHRRQPMEQTRRDALKYGFALALGSAAAEGAAAANGAAAEPAKEETKAPTVLAFSPDGKWLAIGGFADGSVQFIGMTTDVLEKLPDASGMEPCRSLAWTPDSQCLVIGYSGGRAAFRVIGETMIQGQLQKNWGGPGK